MEYQAAYDLTAYLIGLGHRRIGFIKGDPAHSSSRSRIRSLQGCIAQRRAAAGYEHRREGFLQFSVRRAGRQEDTQCSGTADSHLCQRRRYGGRRHALRPRCRHRDSGRTFRGRFRRCADLALHLADIDNRAATDRADGRQGGTVVDRSHSGRQGHQDGFGRDDSGVRDHRAGFRARRPAPRRHEPGPATTHRGDRALYEPLLSRPPPSRPPLPRPSLP